MLLEEKLTETIIGAAIEVHRQLGPGLLEIAYRRALCHELALRGVKCRPAVDVPLFFKGVDLKCNFEIDVFVEETVIVELKAVETVLDVHEAQLITYMKLSHKRVGLLINFNVPRLIDGITRRVL